mmetsp:Transcript_20978/g.34671  ORF Transcript_20978/g.34671 Transcript_20978/m.34671 type:complete len:307 (+) Transcript_20978:1932-2852(+)
MHGCFEQPIRKAIDENETSNSPSKTTERTILVVAGEEQPHHEDDKLQENVRWNSHKVDAEGELLNLDTSLEVVLAPALFFSVHFSVQKGRQQWEPTSFNLLFQLIVAETIVAVCHAHATSTDIINTPLSIFLFVETKGTKSGPWLSHSSLGVGKIIQRVSPHVPTKRERNTLGHLTRFSVRPWSWHKGENQHDTIFGIGVLVGCSTVVNIHVHQHGITSSPVTVFADNLEALFVAKRFHRTSGAKMSSRTSRGGAHFLGRVLQLNKDTVRRTKRAPELHGRCSGDNIVVPVLILGTRGGSDARHFN